MHPRLLALSLLLLAPLASAQTYRDELRLARQAVERGDLEAHLAHLNRVLEMDHDRIGRPYYQYQIARAHALRGENETAMGWLENGWEEGIEGPMMSLAIEDPAFAETRELPRFAALVRAMENAPIRIRHLAGTVHQIDGAGCSLLASIGPDGILVVDTGYPITANAVAAAIRAISPLPIRYTINTHEHSDHLGGNAVLGAGAARIAHEDTRTAAAKAEEFVHGFTPAPHPETRWPNVTVDGAATVHFNGETIRIVPLPAHTTSDLVVHFVKAGVVHLGDNFFDSLPLLYPGRDARRFFSTLGEIVDALPANGHVASGHSDTIPATKFRETWTRSLALLENVAAMKKAGRTEEEIFAATEKDGLPARYGVYYARALPEE